MVSALLRRASLQASLAASSSRQASSYSVFYLTHDLLAISLLSAWTANPLVHWIGTVIGLCLTLIGVFIVFQCMLMYIAFAYPPYAASLFAANDFSRSSFAARSVMFSRPMFITLGINWGVSVLAFLNVACCICLYGLW